jgi:type IV pilus assembly protein PilX
MMSYSYRTRFAQRGVVLVSSLLLLIVVTIIALSLFRSFGMQEKIAGNMREKQRALQAAESAQVFAEIWLSNNATALSVTCAGMLDGTIGQGQICANTLPTVVPNGDVTIVPWKITGVPVGVTYLPTGATTMSINNASILTYSPANLANPTYSDLLYLRHGPVGRPGHPG